jgi:hypothetical protein
MAEPPKVINLMVALKRSVAQDAEQEAKLPRADPRVRRFFLTDVKELLPVSGGNGKTDAAVAELAASIASKRCKNAE